MSNGFFNKIFGGSNASSNDPTLDGYDQENETQLSVTTEGHLSPKLKIRQDMLADIRNSMAEFENSVNAAKDLSSFSTTGLTSAKAMLKDVELDLDSQIRIEGENMVLRNRMVEIEKQLQNKQSELASQVAVAESAQARFDETQEELQSVKDKIVTYQQGDEENKLVIEQLQKAHRLLETENDQRKQAISSLETENLAVTENVSQMHVELNALRETATGNEKEANEWKRVNQNTNERLEIVQSDLQKMRTSFSDMQRQKIELGSQLQATKEELNSEAKRVVDQIRNKDAKIYSLESKNEVLEANSRIAEQRLDSIKVENNDLGKANSILEKQADALKTKIDNTRKSHELDRESLYRSSDRIAELDLKITSTISELNQTKSENDSYAAMVEDLTRKNAELSEKLIKLSAVEKNHEQLVRAIREKSDLKVPASRSKKSRVSDDNIVAMKSSKSA